MKKITSSLKLLVFFVHKVYIFEVSFISSDIFIKLCILLEMTLFKNIKNKINGIKEFIHLLQQLLFFFKSTIYMYI